MKQSRFGQLPGLGFKHRDIFLTSEEEADAMPYTEDVSALVRAVSKRIIMCKILKFMSDARTASYSLELSYAIDAGYENIGTNLVLMEKMGLLKRTTLPLQRNTKYFEIKDKTIVEKIIRRYVWLLGFRLVHFVPFNEYISVEALKSNPEFQQSLKKYYLNFEEAMESLRINRKIESSYSDGFNRYKNPIAFKRQAQ